ncbi:MAG TPA: flavodoxin-dependent (E)-4-hydroxy-3-methylbut-2-enyl-diphosphate synthase [Petrotogaceae bacterium]|jgi:(E)-4-hydroxy-3-methylbut-2-enyl-diphosphate synthase|nr:flavodoxin-dependent (E)-4-hydroxy-3-methylbut-2-enyl-diphosphate synthase [Petrotogaceae bacterium]
MFSKKTVKVKNIFIGGEHEIVIQSMTNTDTLDISSTLNQINNLYELGAQLIRVSVRSLDDIESFRIICASSKVPLCADIHFDYRVAVESIKAGASKIRLNPGNIGAEWKVREVVNTAREYGVPIRIGVNSGSIKKEFSYLERYKALAESCLEELRILESMEFGDVVLSLKSSDAMETYNANLYVAGKVDYPMHLGVTEAGVWEDSIILSSAGIGSLLFNKIGDTIRVSISGDPLQEVTAAQKMLTLLGYLKGPRVIACPTCARTQIDVAELAKKVKIMTADIHQQITIAVMGCVVNGPGEAKDADIAVAGSGGAGVIFVKGKIVKKVERSNLEKELMDEIQKMICGR